MDDEQQRACQSCTFLNPNSATVCAICHAKLPDGRKRKKAAHEADADRRAREEALKKEQEVLAAPKATMEREGYSYHSPDAFAPGWTELVGQAARAAEQLLREDACAERSERKLETINSHRRQLRFVPEGRVPSDPAMERRVPLGARSRAIHDCARALKAQLGAGMDDWVAQDLYVLHTPREEEGAKARAAQSWHFDSLKKFAVAALVLRGAHPTEFPCGRAARRPEPATP